MTIVLLITWITSTGAAMAPQPYRFATMDLCDNALSLMSDDIITRGGTVHSAVCAPQSLKRIEP